MFEIYRQALAELDREERRRALAPIAGIDFSSNDYLGLAASGALKDAVRAALERGAPVGAGASRLLRGNHPEHEELEARAAAFFGTEAALYFASGYLANFAVLTTLPQRGDLIVHDALIHASAHEGMRAGRADCVAAAHNDAAAFDGAISTWRARGGKGRPWLLVESLYSMDGDKAPLAELMEVAGRHEAMLLVDEAHATGVFGPGGRGLAAAFEGRENVIVVHTCGKALGVAGALVCVPALLRDFLVNRCRPFIFSTGPSPLTAVAVMAALDIVAREPERRERLHALIGQCEAGFEERLGRPGSGSQIFPVIVGDNGQTMEIAARLQQRGFDIRGIRPPTVPAGTSRLRIAVTLNVEAAQISAMLEAVGDELKVAGP